MNNVCKACAVVLVICGVFVLLWFLFRMPTKDSPVVRRESRATFKRGAEPPPIEEKREAGLPMIPFDLKSEQQRLPSMGRYDELYYDGLFPDPQDVKVDAEPGHAGKNE